MSEGWAGWVEAHELPAAEHLRTAAEILRRPRRQRSGVRCGVKRRKRRRNAAARDAADIAAAAAFLARINGTPPRDVLAEAAAEPSRDREATARRRAAIDVLRALGLQDLITGGQSGVVFDANMGVLEPVRDVAERAALDRRYVAERSERLAEQGRTIVNRSRVQLAERRRAGGWTGGSHPGRPGRTMPPGAGTSRLAARSALRR